MEPLDIKVTCSFVSTNKAAVVVLVHATLGPAVLSRNLGEGVEKAAQFWLPGAQSTITIANDTAIIGIQGP